ncbi:hypothetical protein [Aliikangiella sp. G2MR2-5]|uniref:hypothetical protein n=1 Tax=Aliikangiella sp. G2MR2-5 TaxID=2788943 RepID=UPI0018A922A4|nr:hypothetical protein [Aliikangiella sp. G2MR2-5]
MPKHFSQITTDHNGEMIFFSSQDSIIEFLGGPQIESYEGVCLALVMMWLAQDTSKTSPLAGIRNKTRACNLQSEMESDWRGFETVAAKGQEVIAKNFWWKSDQKENIMGDTPSKYLLNDPLNSRDGLHILVLYQEEGSGHAIGVWRFPSGAIAIYDPNQGACVQRGENLEAFLQDFIGQVYPEMTSFAVCSWYSEPND